MILAICAWCATSIATTVSRPDAYPEHAALNCIEGWVVLSYSVNSEGKAESVNVEESEPTGVFEEAAIKQLMRQNFDPNDVSSETPVQRRHMLRFTYELDDYSYEPCAGT
ncbi:TonB family protein [Parahaliea mediterranea]|uniref:Protein TonB n=2 Tax=Parahaliea mediterranea TaxID=651086 RepID=A0A939DJ32_9GAMM|nr:TonB family protein [Parahaliea mediterranea]